MSPPFARSVILALLIALGAAPVAAVQPDEILKDPQLEFRAREISAELRCLVCQNQSIDDSDAPLARDLRLLVRERLRAGDSNSKVIAFLVDRYGDFVLLRPRLSANTYALWIAPLLIFLSGLFIARRAFLGNSLLPASPPPELTDEEKRKLERYLVQEPESRG